MISAISTRITAAIVAAVLLASACSGSAQVTSEERVSEQPDSEEPVSEQPDSEQPDSEQEVSEQPDSGQEASEEPVESGEKADLSTVRVELEVAAEVGGTPIAMATHPDGESLIIAEKEGFVRLWQPNGTGGFSVANQPPLIDLSNRTSQGNEQGILGLAVSPGEQLFLVHSDLDGHNQLLRFELDGTGEALIMTVEQPLSNHNGGNIAFGPDGFLYYGLGDGGGAGDPLSTGQDNSDLLGSIVRIDPNTEGDGYEVPADSPFLESGDGRPEIWLYGVRNPWRFAFDSETGDLWVADVGQNSLEEVTALPATNGVDAGREANLGWPAFEGSVPFGPGNPENAIGPIVDYGRDEGCSITGGYVARGDNPGLNGAYLYADYCTGTIWGATPNDSLTGAEVTVLGSTETDHGPVSFGEGHDGRLYLLTDAGQLLRIVAVDR